MLIGGKIGGSNSALNLWPQSYETQPLNAHVKDKLENRMHKLICDGKLDIRQAQEEIAKDWVAAYAKYVGPLPGGTGKSVSGSGGVGAGKADGEQDAGGCPASMPVKVSNNGIYHVPGGSFYARTTHVKACYATPADAEAAGYRASKR